MTQWASLIPIFFFAAFIGTVLMAPIYYLTANKLEPAGQITLTLAVAVVLGGAILVAATNKTPGETDVFNSAMTVVILTPLATGWIISAFISLLIWAFDRRPASHAETGSDQLPKFQEEDLPRAEGGELSSRRGAALDHQENPLSPTLQPAEPPPPLPSRDARQAQPVD
jgi:hypothetical protein